VVLKNKTEKKISSRKWKS